MMMRAFFVVMILALVQSTFAQSKKIELGVKAGFNYSSLNLKADGQLSFARYHWYNGYHLGAYASVKLKKVSVQPEILFSNQGQYFTTPYNSNLRSSLNYINIPIMVKYYLVGSLHVQVGPQFGFLAGAKGDLIPISPNNGVSNGSIAGPPYQNQNIKNYLKAADLSLVAGAGINLPAHLNLTVRYVYGITDINKSKLTTDFAGRNEPSFSTSYTTNQVFQVSIGYQLKSLGK